MDPRVLEGFQKEYGVKVIQSNFDSMEGMVGKLAAGNRYDIIFPSAQWVQKLDAADRAHRIDHSTLQQRRRRSSTATPTSPTRGTTRSPRTDPVHDVQDRHRLAQGQARRPDRHWNDLWNDDREGHALRPRRPRRGARHGRAAARVDLNTGTARPRPDRRQGRLAAAHLRGFGSDDYNNLLAGNAWLTQAWSGDMAVGHLQPTTRPSTASRSPSEGAPVNTDTYAIPSNAQHPGTALLFIDYMLRPENVEKNINYIGYPMPVHGTEAIYEELMAPLPALQGDRRRPRGGPLLHQPQRRRHPGPRRRVHEDQGRLMSSARKSDRQWTWLLLPGTLWMSVFFVSALALVIALSFGRTDELGNPRFSNTLENIRGILEWTYLRVIIRSLVYSLSATAICLLISYPVAYVIARHGGRYRNALVALIVVPFFANYLVRMYGWQTLLSDDGVVMKRLRDLGVSPGFHILDTAGAVIGGLVYGYIVFMVLPVYASLQRMDGSLIEAGRDLYGSPLRTFLTVTVPGHPRRSLRRHRAGLPPGHGRLHQRAAARRSQQPDDRQPDPGEVLRRPELAAGVGADDDPDAAPAGLHVRLPAPDRA